MFPVLRTPELDAVLLYSGTAVSKCGEALEITISRAHGGVKCARAAPAEQMVWREDVLTYLQ